MKTIKIIDLLIKNANGEEMPKEIIFENYRYYKHPEGYFRSVINSNWIALTTDFNIYDILNDEVEILEEEKKIPEKLKIEQGSLSNNFYIKNEFGTSCNLTKHSKIIADKINEILDYLKSKEE